MNCLPWKLSVPKTLGKAIFVFLSSIFISPTVFSYGQENTFSQWQSALIAQWLVTVEGESRPRVLKINRIEQKAEKTILIDSEYGFSDEKPSPIKAEITLMSADPTLVLITQADSKIVATQASNGDFLGTFTPKNGKAKAVKIERTSEADLALKTATRSEVSLPGAGINLGGILFRPGNSNEPLPAIIVLHGWGESNVNGAGQVERTARELSRLGYVVLAVSMRGWPKSDGVDDCGLKQPDDIAMAANWLASLPYVNAERIGIHGSSQGGQVALLTAARSARIKAVVAQYPVIDTDRWQKTSSLEGIRNNYVPRICGFGNSRSPLFYAEKINSAVLLVHGDKDTRVPTEQSVMMYEALNKANRTVELHIIPEAAHGFNQNQREQVWPLVTKFFNTYLREVK